jgi:hypothetical protein
MSNKNEKRSCERLETINDFLNEEQINRIYNEFNNVFVIRYKPDTEYNGKYVGRLLLKISLKKNNNIKINDDVVFSVNKIKWRNDNVCVVNPHWVKKFLDGIKLKIKSKVLNSRINGNNERIYYYDYEYIELNYKQFISKKLVEDFGNIKHNVIEAYFNFYKRRKKVGYYKALNETSKHYMVEHDYLRNIIVPNVSNALKNYKKEWFEFYIQTLENEKVKNSIKELNEEKKEHGKIIKFKKN